jgi:hypothetical protein
VIAQRAASEREEIRGSRIKPSLSHDSSATDSSDQQTSGSMVDELEHLRPSVSKDVSSSR